MVLSHAGAPNPETPGPRGPPLSSPPPPPPPAPPRRRRLELHPRRREGVEVPRARGRHPVAHLDVADAPAVETRARLPAGDARGDVLRHDRRLSLREHACLRQ